MANKQTKNALDIVDQMIGADDQIRTDIAEETIHSRVASLLFDARDKAGLTQTQLAELIGTKQSVIARLESANYEGHSLSMLVRIATALGNRIEISLVPRDVARRTA